MTVQLHRGVTDFRRERVSEAEGSVPESSELGPRDGEETSKCKCMK